MPLSEIFPAERDAPEEQLSATVRQLEALTALASAPGEGRALEELFAGLADTITELTDYRSCLVLLFSDDGASRRILSHSSNIPREYIEASGRRPYKREDVARLVERGVRIEVGELGFAAYYPPSHYHLLEQFAAPRFKADLLRPLPEYGAAPWNEGDELFVPLTTHDGEFIGLIALDDPRSGRAPDRRSVLPAVAFARQTAQLIARQRDAEKLSTQARREALVNRITRAVRRSLDMKEVFAAATSELGLHLGVDRCAVFMLDREAGVVRCVAEYRTPEVESAEEEYSLKVTGPLVEKIKERGVLAFEDVENDPAIRPVYEHILKRLGTRSIMYVAIRVGDELPGCFVISSVRERRRWRAEDIVLAAAVADQTGIALRQAELYQRAEATSAREALVNRLGHAIRASLNLPEVLGAATHELGRALKASRVYIRPYDPSNPDDSPVMYEYLDGVAEHVGATGISYGMPVGRHLIETHRTLVIDDAFNYEGETPEISAHVRELARRNGGLSKIVCPLVVQGQFRGALCIHQTDRLRRWARDEVALVESVAAQLATGIAQAELFEMVERAKRTWETTFDAMSDGIFIFSNERRLMRVNRAGALLEAAGPHELLGRRCCDILRAGRGEGCIVERATAEGRPVTLEYTPERLGRTLLVTAEPVMDEAGQTGTVCTVRDLSELRQIEAVARERQSLLEHVLESARENICAVDPDGRIVWINSAGASMCGYPKEALIGRHFAVLIEESERGVAVERFRRTLAGEPQTVELRLLTGGGKTRHIVTDTTPLVTDGRTTGVLSMTRDVTELRQERERAAQADKLRALGQLASGVAHDFNNALAAILGRAQLLRRSVEGGGDFAHGLDIILTAAEDAAATVRRIRSFAHQLPAESREGLDVLELLRDAVEITRTRWENDARARGLDYEVTVECECECGLRTHGNASELREVFVNLIVNAIDAMPEGGRLSILCRTGGGRMQMLFTDTGTGMTEEVRARIFEPFFTTKGVHGTGLGLFVSYGIVERHGGQISASSRPGCGTTFKIDLPHVEEAPHASEHDPAPCKVALGRSLSVLVVDDEEAVRWTLAEIVAALGHSVRTADGGRAALEALEAEEFDVVFTDLSMPEMDGWEVARAVRRRSPRTRIAVVTGYGRDAERTRGDAPADTVIGKPFDFSQVEEVLTQFGG
ncbi:MAG TPA: GAF domain-containing protein [Pyrinomonadaceae bacterium]|jgi:PAS domain S-box-containing protein|nr:GAF domain-containing protein [Pyrinomonadaceae bacterium]